jgi:integrase
MGDPVRCSDAIPDRDVLRLYEGHSPAGPAGLSADLTLSQLVERYYKPVHLLTHDAQPRYIEEIDQTVKYWALFTGDPPLSAIDVWSARNFIVGLKALPGRKYPTMANNTVRKHAGEIQTILDLCGPPTRDNREGLGLLDTVPYIPRPPREEKPAEDCYSFDELVRLVENAEAALLPKSIGGRAIQPASYFRRIYALIFSTGMRIGGVMGATWKHYRSDGATPHLWLPPKVAAKGRVGKRVELNEQAHAVIESMRGFDAERIFPWPRKWPSSRNNLYRQHDLIRAALPEGRQDFLAFHALRKLHTNELAGINGLACMKSLGHANVRTTVEHYTSTSVVRQAVAKLPHVPIDTGRQRTLFE